MARCLNGLLSVLGLHRLRRRQGALLVVKRRGGLDARRLGGCKAPLARRSLRGLLSARLSLTLILSLIWAAGSRALWGGLRLSLLRTPGLLRAHLFAAGLLRTLALSGLCSAALILLPSSTLALLFSKARLLLLGLLLLDLFAAGLLCALALLLFPGRAMALFFDAAGLLLLRLLLLAKLVLAGCF